MRVRPASPSDAAEIQRVQAKSAREAYEGVLDDETLIERMEDASTIEDLEKWLAATADDERVVYLVATDRADAVVGFLQLLAGERAPDRTAPDEAFLKSLYVHPDRWGEGVGSALLSAAIDRLPRGVTTVSLAVLSNNRIGIGFYEKRGFERVGTGEYETDGVAYETAVYARSLDG